jgi:Kef-type K+ transport system membrane component KefB
MNGMLQFATLLVTTVLTVGTAVFLNWLLLRMVFQWMQPTSPRERMTRSSVNLVPGTVQLVRAFGAHR